MAVTLAGLRDTEEISKGTPHAEDGEVVETGRQSLTGGSRSLRDVSLRVFVWPRPVLLWLCSTSYRQ